jgi:hypothetical protein
MEKLNVNKMGEQNNIIKLELLLAELYVTMALN